MSTFSYAVYWRAVRNKINRAALMLDNTVLAKSTLSDFPSILCVFEAKMADNKMELGQWSVHVSMYAVA